MVAGLPKKIAVIFALLLLFLLFLFFIIFNKYLSDRKIIDSIVVDSKSKYQLYIESNDLILANGKKLLFLPVIGIMN